MARQIVDLDSGGTNADLSQTGPGYLKQAYQGDPITIGDLNEDLSWSAHPKQPDGVNNTAVTMAMFNAVYYIGPNNDIALAKADDFTTSRCCGLVAYPLEDGWGTNVVSEGQFAWFDDSVWQAIIEGNAGSGLTVGEEYWLSENNAGMLKTSAPDTPGAYIVYIGRAIDTYRILINIDFRGQVPDYPRPSPHGLANTVYTGGGVFRQNIPLKSAGQISTIDVPVSVYGSSPLYLTVDPSGRFLYVSFYNTNSTIEAFRINNNGSLTSLGNVTAFVSDGPGRELVCDPAGLSVFHACHSGNIEIYNIQPDGTLSQHSEYGVSSTFLGGIACEPSGRFGYVTDNVNDLVYPFVINPSNGIVLLNGVATGDEPLAVCCEALGRYVYVSNSGDATVSQYSIDQSTGALTPIGAAVACGTSPVCLCTDHEGRWVYSVNYLGHSVTVFNIDPIDGSLSFQKTITVGTYPSCMTMDPLSRFAYITAANPAASDPLLQFVVREDGDLWPIPNPPLTGAEPRSIKFDPSSRFAYICDATDNNIQAYTLDRENIYVNDIKSYIGSKISSVFTVNNATSQIEIGSEEYDQINLADDSTQIWTAQQLRMEINSNYIRCLVPLTGWTSSNLMILGGQGVAGMVEVADRMSIEAAGTFGAYTDPGAGSLYVSNNIKLGALSSQIQNSNDNVVLVTFGDSVMMGNVSEGDYIFCQNSDMHFYTGASLAYPMMGISSTGLRLSTYGYITCQAYSGGPANLLIKGGSGTGGRLEVDNSLSVMSTGTHGSYTDPGAGGLFVEGDLVLGSLTGILRADSGVVSTTTIPASTLTPTAVTGGSSYTVLSTDSYIRVTGSGTTNLSLPAATGSGQAIWIKGPNNTTIIPDGTDTIEGNNSNYVFSSGTTGNNILIVDGASGEWDRLSFY